MLTLIKTRAIIVNDDNTIDSVTINAHPLTSFRYDEVKSLFIEYPRAVLINLRGINYSIDTFGLNDRDFNHELDYMSGLIIIDDDIRPDIELKSTFIRINGRVYLDN